MRFLRRSLVGIFLMAVTLSLIAYAGATMWSAVQARLTAEPRSFPQRERVVTVNVVTLEAETLTPELRAFGELVSRRTLDIRAPVGGTVLEVSDEFVNGGRVAQGDLLLRIDPVEAEEALASVRADLQDAEAEARDAERGLILAQDELAAAQAQAALRDQALSRQRDLQSRGVGTAPDLEAAELAASAAAQSVLSQRAALAQAEARIDQAATLTARTRITVTEAERTLAGTEITAAFDGTLAGVSVLPGGRVTDNEQIAQLVDPFSLEVEFRVSTSDYAGLLDEDGRLIGAPVTVALDVSGVELVATGTISRESAGVSEGQTGRLIYARLDEARGFRPGDFVTVAVAEPAQEQVARLPASALAADGTVLVVTDDDRLRVAEVELVRRQGDDVIVRAPDIEGERVVAQRSPVLGPGILVNALDRSVPADEVAEAEETEVVMPAAEDLIELDAERRARLVAFIEASERLPTEAKSRLLSQLEGAMVPAAVVARIESRMGG